MKKLLHKDVNKRLNPTDIPCHPWLKGVDFEKASKLEMKPFYVPAIKNESDISNIDPVFLSEDIYSPYKEVIVCGGVYDDKLFEEF